MTLEYGHDAQMSGLLVAWGMKTMGQVRVTSQREKGRKGDSGFDLGPLRSETC